MRWMLYATLAAALFGLFTTDLDAFGRRGSRRGGCANGSCGGTVSFFSAAGCSSGACSTPFGTGMMNGSCINGTCTPEQWMAANPPQPAYNTLTVTCPDDCELYVEGQATKQRGTTRTFSWEGKGGEFHIKCRWKDGPNVREQTKTVPAAPGCSCEFGTHKTALLGCSCGPDCDCGPFCDCR